MFNSNDEDLVEDVASIRNQLRLTEISLQSLGEQLSHSGHDIDSHSERSDNSPGHGLPGRLTLEDLQQPDVTRPSPCHQSLERSSRTESRNASSRSRGVEMEALPLRKKLGGLRQENACLAMENRQLISDLEAAHVELASSKSKVRLLGNTFGAKASSVNVLREQILGLEAEVEAQANELRAAELKAEQSQQAAAQSERLASVLRDELSMLRTELTDTTRQGKRAEQQRNQALHNAEKLTDAFKDYKADISIKLKKVMESESHLKESLIECDREREELENKCCALERERGEQAQNISKLTEELTQARTFNTKTVELQGCLEEAAQRTSRLEMELGERAFASRDLAALRRETEELRALTQSQEQRLAQCHREAQQRQAEMTSLESILALLHLREDSNIPVCGKPCMLPIVDYTADLRTKPGEHYQQLLPVLQAVEAERARQSSLATRLQERLSKAQDEITSLHSSMAQRASHYQHLHSELLDRASQSNDAQKELKKKSARVSALEKQLQEKSSAYSQAALKNSQLEQEILEKASTIQHYQSVMAKKQRDFQQALEKCHTNRSDQNQELQDKLDVLQLSLDRNQARVSELEQALNFAQMESHEAQNTAVFLQASLDQLTQERETNVRNSEEVLQRVKEQQAESVIKVRQLETALLSCREELSTSLQQIEEAQERHQRQMDLKSQELLSLHEELRSSSVLCRRSGEQCAQLQTSLLQQQGMLQESTSRVAELEDSQSQLQGQVSALEQDLERARSSLEEDRRRREKELQDADMEVQEKRRQTAQLSGSVTQLSSEMSKCRGELLAMEQDLQRLRSDASIKSSQISQIEETLQKTQGLLEKKNDAVVGLEEKLHVCEQDRRNSVHRATVLEGQLQDVRTEMQDTLENLQELRDLLQRTQATADERQVSLERLSIELRESQRELEERNHEVLDMDTALKERQGELQQRAQLLGQLDVTIRDHKLEMDKKVRSLQEALDRRAKEVRDKDKQVASLSEKLDLLKADLQLKEDLEKDSLEQGQSLRTCREQLQELRGRYDNLNRELNSLSQHANQKEVQVRSLEEELSARGKHWVLGEARFQATITSLQQELEQEKEQHNKEVSSLQQTRSQLLKVSEQMSCSLRSSQEHLASRLQQTQLQLEQARVQGAHLQAQLHTTEASLQSTQEALLIKESEVTRLQARMSSLDRATELHRTNSYLHPDPSQPSSPPTRRCSPPRTHSYSPSGQNHTRTPHRLASNSPPATPDSDQPPQTHTPDCSTGASIVDSSLDLPESLKDSLRGVLGQHLPRGSSLSRSPTPHHPDLSWQGLSRLDATSSDLSFNPLTYMVDDKGVVEERNGTGGESLLGRQTQEEVDMSSLTGMLRFVNQTLALQDDPSLWGSSGLPESEHTLTLKVSAPH